MHSIKTKHIIWVIVISFIGFMSPIMLKANSDSWNATLSLSFTVVGAIGTIVTIAIAVLLFDKFGITAKFKEKQVWEVIELAIVLLNTRISATSDKLTYFVNVTQSSETIQKGLPQYKIDSPKALLFPSNFETLITEIYGFMNSHWLPKEIKDKMKIFDIMGLMEIEDLDKSKYVKINFNNKGNDEWMGTIPNLTLEMLNINLHELYNTIDIWLKKHSDIAPSFFKKNS